MKKLLFTLAAILMASSAFAGHWVTFEAEDFEYTSGDFFVDKDNVVLEGYGRIDEDHFRFYANHNVIVSHTGGIMKIEFTCIGEDEGQYGPGNFDLNSRGDYSFEGNIGLWEDGYFTGADFTPYEESAYFGNEAVTPLQQVSLEADYQVRCTKIRVYVLDNEPVTVGAPVFSGYTIDGVTGYGVGITPTTENSEIMYRVLIWDPVNEEWVVRDDWSLYDGNEREIWFENNGEKVRIEAYAFIGENRSQDVAYEFTVATALNELMGGKTVASTRYFNVAGQEMKQAEGLTIVVTTYTDGTTSAAKVVK